QSRRRMRPKGMHSPSQAGGHMQDRKEVMKRWCGVMEWLDRLGYLTAGFSLLVLGMLIFAHAWYVFITKAGDIGLLPSGLKLLNDLLLVIILLELFRTVIRFLQTEILDLEPYLAVGIIACTRRVLTASAELSHQTNMTETQFYQYLMDVGLNVTVIMVLVVGVFLVRKRPAQSLAVTP
ncbi:MAG TPA: phosphate-starvation-inducible PsiE family protein, partial [Nitrospira sp.]|nr:phosphate-starvation-inducible PsiE family protein [Nitrospira sp.]